jgi:hypothetical protein
MRNMLDSKLNKVLKDLAPLAKQGKGTGFLTSTEDADKLGSYAVPFVQKLTVAKTAHVMPIFHKFYGDSRRCRLSPELSSNVAPKVRHSHQMYGNRPGSSTIVDGCWRLSRFGRKRSTFGHDLQHLFATIRHSFADIRCLFMDL